MPTLEYFLLARDAVVDRFTDSLSLVSVVDEIVPRRFPTMFGHLVAAIGWNATPDEYGRQVQVTLSIRPPGGEPPVTSNLDFTVQSRRHRLFSRLIAFPVAQPGEVVFEVSVNGRAIAHHSVLVNEADPQVPPDGWLLYTTPPAPTPAPENAAGAPEGQRDAQVEG